MHTQCRVYEGMEDEYDMEAADIVDMLGKGVPFRSAYFSSMSYHFWSDWALERKREFFLIQASYYDFLSKHQPGAAAFAPSPEICPALTALSVSSACDALLAALSESIQTGACKSMRPARAGAPKRYAWARCG